MKFHRYLLQKSNGKQRTEQKHIRKAKNIISNNQIERGMYNIKKKKHTRGIIFCTQNRPKIKSNNFHLSFFI